MLRILDDSVFSSLGDTQPRGDQHEEISSHGRREVGDCARARLRCAGLGSVSPARDIGHDSVEQAFRSGGRDAGGNPACARRMEKLCGSLP